VGESRDGPQDPAVRPFARAGRAKHQNSPILHANSKIWVFSFQVLTQGAGDSGKLKLKIQNQQLRINITRLCV
jgi:hypothetical protein